MKTPLLVAAHLTALTLLALGAELGIAAPATQANAAAAPAPAAVDWRTPDPNNVLVIDTTKGRILVELTPEVAPQAAARLRDLARSGFYDGRAFFRVIDGFMDQTGDPTDTGKGGSTKPDLPAEFTFQRGPATPMVVIDTSGGHDQGFVGPTPVISQPIALAAMTVNHQVNAWPTFCAGVVGIARAEDPNSGNSQFFLMRDANSSLDQKYAAVGRVIAGMDVVRQIKTGEPVAAPQDQMIKVRVLADIPLAERPDTRVIDPAGPWFQAMVKRARVEKLIGLSMCDLDFPSPAK